MTGEFKKLINREFGKTIYDKYVVFVRNNLNRGATSSRSVYNDIYKNLKEEKLEVIYSMNDRLNDTLTEVMKISRTFIVACFAFISALCLVLFLPMNKLCMIGFIAALVIAFGIKAYEFIINKYCVVDMRIVLTYKSVLDKLITAAGCDEDSEDFDDNLFNDDEDDNDHKNE